VTSSPVDSSVSQMLDSQAFLYPNTDPINNAPYAENNLSIEEIDNVSCAGPTTNRPFTAPSEPTQTLNTASRSSLVPIKPLISSTAESRIRPQTAGERSNISHDKVLSIEELRNIENSSINATDDTTLNDSICPSVNTALPPAVVPIAAAAPLPDRPKSGRKRKAESLEEKEARAKDRILRNRAAAQASRNKKRDQMANLEKENAELKAENAALRENYAAQKEEYERLAKRVRILEDKAAESDRLQSQQFQSLQNVLPSPEMTISSYPLDGVRGSAVSVRTLENSSFVSKSLQRTGKLRMMFFSSNQMLKPVSVMIMLIILTLNFGHQYLDKIKKMEFADNFVISELMRRLQKRQLRSGKGNAIISELMRRLQKRRLRSVKSIRGCGTKSGEYEWKYPP